jgi:hypothetical protein
MRGWRHLAAAVDQTVERLRTEGCEPVLAAASWTLPGELGAYCKGRPQAYSLGLALGDRWSQYDLWRPNPVRDPEAFAGRTFVFVGDVCEEKRGAFDRVEEPREVVYREGGQPIARWHVTVCRGFHGFPNRGADARY